MRRIARKTFERIVCVSALALPVLVLVAAGGSGGTTLGPASASDEAKGIPPVASVARAADEAHARPAHPALSYRTSWVGNTWGFADHRWVQIDVQALAVTPDGDIFTNAPWDEGGGEIGHYRDGQLVGYGGDSHGWSMAGGEAIAVNDEYVFVAQYVGALGSDDAKQRRRPREGEQWTGVSRRSRADLRDGVPFAGQVPAAAGSRMAFLLISSYPEKEDHGIRGLAADETRLFVSNPRENRVQIFDAQTMQSVGSFPVRDPGRLALAPDGSLWVVENSSTAGAQHVVHHSRSGARLGELTLPPRAVVADLTLDSRGRLLIADNGPRQQILIFTAAATAAATAATAASSAPSTSASGPAAASAGQPGAGMQLTGTFGEEGGIYSGRVGAAGPRRFNGLTGVGVDRAGNIYVSMNGVGPRAYGAVENTYDGALIESYTPDGKQRFSRQGLLFVDGAQFVDGEPPSIYSGSKRFTLDLSRPAGEEWSYAGYTADRFRYPYDPLFHLNLNGQRGMPMVRDVRGHRLLYTTDMFSAFLKIYRFDTNSETAIPAGLFVPQRVAGAWPPNQPAQGEWIWRNLNGKGDFSAAAFDQHDGSTDAPPMKGWWVDSQGDIWQGTEAQGLRCFPLLGFDRVGNPIYRYSAMRQYPPPAPFYRIARLNYFPADDTMFISGSTPSHPFVQENWNSAGSQLARYDHWKSGKPVLRYVIGLPDRGAPEWMSINGIAVAGDYIFAVETRSAIVRVYDKETGRDVGRLEPGKEVGSTSGWTDVPMPMTAHRLASGEYLVLVEEDAHGKALMYRFTPQDAAQRTSGSVAESARADVHESVHESAPLAASPHRSTELAQTP